MAHDVTTTPDAAAEGRGEGSHLRLRGYHWSMPSFFQLSPHVSSLLFSQLIKYDSKPSFYLRILWRMRDAL